MNPYTVVLGVAQDGGLPHIGCRRDCCRTARTDWTARRLVVCLGLVDPANSQRWLLECTPDFPEQLYRLDQVHPVSDKTGLAGILLTHAHIGHYSGLMYLGREALGATGVPVWAMPRLRAFLKQHGPWEQLVRLKNIVLQPLAADTPAVLHERIRVTPFLVPHRDEYSETVGFRVQGPDRSLLFLPDIDQWDRWQVPIERVLESVDVAYLDGTFFSADELPGRDMSEIPHPLIEQSIGRFSELPALTRRKIRFIHLNHSNPAHRRDSTASAAIRDAGLAVAQEGETVEL